MARSTRSLDESLLVASRPRSALRWLRVLVTVTVCSGAGAAWTFRKPPVYRAESILEYAQDPSAIAKGDGLGAVLSTDEWYNTQDFLLRSHKLADGVAQKLRLHTDRGFFGIGARERFNKQPSDASRRLAEALEIARVPKTRLVRVAIEDTSAKRAAEIANGVAEVYLQQSLESRLDAQRRAMEWLADQIEKAAQQLHHTEVELQTYYEKQDAPSLPVEQQQELLATEIKSLTQVLTEARVRRIELGAQVAKIKAAQSENPFDVHTVEIDQNEQVKQLAAEYQVTFIKFRELSASGTTGAAIDAEQSRLQTLTERMRAALAGVTKSAQGELAAAQSVENQVQGQLETVRRQAQQLQRHQLEYGRIERDRQDTAKLLATLRERSTALGVASASAAANARVVELATIPSKPEMPKWPLGAALGALVGLVLAALTKRAARLWSSPRFTLKA